MAEEHDELVRTFRQKLIGKGFKLGKSPTPAYRPDVFAERFGSSEKLLEQALAEAELEKTLFHENTADQLLIMHDFIWHQRKRRILARGYLLVPRRKQALALAKSLLSALFPTGTAIRIVQN